MSNIAYLRVSHTESLNGTSLEVQEKRCKAFAELHNFNIDYVYSEIVSGGVEFRKRPVFQKVLKELKSGSKLVVSRLDRLSRKVVDTLSLVDDFKKEHKEICITDIGNIHTDGVSKIFVTILASLAEIERENISNDNYEFIGSLNSQYKQIGNAVPVELARRIGIHMKNLIKTN